MEDIDLDCVKTNMYNAHYILHTKTHMQAPTKKHRHKDTQRNTVTCHTSFVAIALVAGDNYKSPADLRVCGPK